MEGTFQLDEFGKIVPISYSTGFQVGLGGGIRCKGHEVKDAMQMALASGRSATAGSWLADDGSYHVEPCVWIEGAATATLRAAQLGQAEIWDWANNRAIPVSPLCGCDL